MSLPEIIWWNIVGFLWKCRYSQAAMVCRILFCCRFRWSEGRMCSLQSYVQVLAGYDTDVRHDMAVDDWKLHNLLRWKATPVWNKSPTFQRPFVFPMQVNKFIAERVGASHCKSCQDTKCKDCSSWFSLVPPGKCQENKINYLGSFFLRHQI
jgi:hypothetical protein